MSVGGSKEICFIKSESLLYYIAGSLIEWIEIFLVIGYNMNQNTEYEKYTQEIYQQLLNTDFGNVKTVEVLHNVKLRGWFG